MDKSEDFISLRDVVTEMALPKRAYDRSIHQRIRQPAQSILSNPQSEEYFSGAAQISEAAKTLAEELTKQENFYLESSHTRERSRFWLDADATEKAGDQPELFAEVLFLLNLLGHWADRVSSSSLPSTRLDQVLPLARSRDRNRMERIGLARNDAEHLVKSMAPRWDRRQWLHRKLFSNAVSSSPDETDSATVPLDGSSFPSSASPSASSSADSSLNLESAATIFSRLQGSSNIAPGDPIIPTPHTRDLFFRWAKLLCDRKNASMRDVYEHILAMLYHQATEGKFDPPFKGIEDGKFVFIRNLKRTTADEQAIKDQIRKNPRIMEIVQTDEQRRTKKSEE